MRKFARYSVVAVPMRQGSHVSDPAPWSCHELNPRHLKFDPNSALIKVPRVQEEGFVGKEREVPDKTGCSGDTEVLDELLCDAQ